MTTMDTIAPFELLRKLESRSKQTAIGLPEQAEAVQLWNGVGFSLAGLRFVVAMGEVVEILHLPKATQVPGVKSWMHGVANVRGRLLPVMDLGQFFKLPAQSRAMREKRVLIIEQDDFFSGLIVDGVLGMQYFPVTSHTTATSGLTDSVQRCVSGSYVRDDTHWHVFETSALLADSSFVEIASG
ncbi:chemotaxis protein CheW [Allohahella marinimesophila]